MDDVGTPVSEDAVAITQRELLLEMREEIRSLRRMLEDVAREQAITVERRSSMQTRAASIDLRLDTHEKAIAELQRWRDEAAGAIKLARWALGASLLASILLVFQIAAAVADLFGKGMP